MINNKLKNEHYDVVIIGGGIIGLTAAAGLSQLGLTIAVIERAPFVNHKIIDDTSPYDLRVFAINHASKKIFSDVGVWQDMQQMRVNPYKRMLVWDTLAQGEIEFTAEMVNKNNLGHIIENQVIQGALFNHIRKNSNITLLNETQIAHIELANTAITLLTQQGEVLSTKLIIGADGADSWLREYLAIPFIKRDYGHHAIVTTVKTELPHQQTAWQHFTPDGPLAFLPLSDPHHCSIVWSTLPDKANYLAQLADTEFSNELSASFNRLGRAESNVRRITYPLRMQHTQQYVHPRVALVGDALHTIHPLAGLGVNLGLQDIAALIAIISQRVAAKKDIGSLMGLRQYERQRKGENLATIALMDGFKQLFTHQLAPLQWLRGFGLNLTNQLLPLKQFCIRQAMGE